MSTDTHEGRATVPKLVPRLRLLDVDGGERPRGKPITSTALDPKIKALVRETVQNTIDAALDGKTPELRYRLERLTGDELQEFVSAFGWEKLREHYETVAETDDELGVGEILQQIDDGDGELLVLAIEDYNVAGLAGEEGSLDSNWGALVESFGVSNKEETEGGSHGVGASVFWIYSGLQTVVFNTTVAEQATQQPNPRLIGCVDLPYHEVAGTKYAGDGYIGVESGAQGLTRPTRATGGDAESVAEQLRVDRDDDRPGTTGLIVGFREPTRQTRDPDELMDAIATCAAEFYWPQLIEGQIDISVQGPGDDDPRPVNPRSFDGLSPFIAAYETYRGRASSSGGGEPVLTTDLPLDVPDRAGGVSGATGTVGVALSPRGEDVEGTNVNHVALLRGARHVVKYRRYRTAARTAGADFYGVALAGGARHGVDTEPETWPDGDRAVEKFLRDAEPEAHDTWEEGTERLRNNYSGGITTIRTFLRTDLHEAIVQLLAGADLDDGDTLELDDFDFFGGPGGNPPGDQVFTHTGQEGYYDGERYVYRGSFGPDVTDPGTWRATVSVQQLDGRGRSVDEIPIAADGYDFRGHDPEYESGVLMFEFPASVRSVPYDVTTVEIEDGDRAGRTGQTELRVDYELHVDGGE